MMQAAVFLILLVAYQGKETHGSQCTNYTTPPSDLKNTSAVLAYLKFDVKCTTSSVSAFLSRCALMALESSGNVTLVYSNGSAISDSGCSPFTSNETTIQLLISRNYSRCASSVKMTETSTTYNFDLRNEEHLASNAIISRDFKLIVQFSCVFQMEYNVSSDSPITTIKQVVNVTAVRKFGSFKETFQLYNDSSFMYGYSLNEAATLQIVIPRRIFFGIKISEVDPKKFVIQGNACWATPSNNPNDSTNYYIVQNGCPVVDSVYADANKVYENYNSTTLKVGFRSFTWTNNVPYLHIHCKYSICDFSVNASCRIQPTCSSSRRRRNIAEDLTAGQLTTYGPIRISTPGLSCKQINGGCSHLCIEMVNGRTSCECPLNHFLKEDGKNCEKLESAPLGHNINDFEDVTDASDDRFLGFNLAARHVKAISIYALVLTFVAFFLVGVNFLAVKSQKKQRRGVLSRSDKQETL